MRAVILVGGEGTRLRPLTSTVPKPVVPLVDRPFMAYMLEWLARNGIDDVVMACGVLPALVQETLGDGSQYGVRLQFVVEPEPRGTGGALRFADEAAGGLGDRFLLLNGDVLTDLDLRGQIAEHEATGARATLALVPVEDPSAYGLVRLADDGAVAGFLEKPQPHEIDTDLISAGAYVLERSVLDLIEPDANVSIERVVWPALVGEGLFGMAHRDAYWLDIGTPERYLQGTADILTGAVDTAVRAQLDADDLAVGAGTVVTGELRGPAVVGEDCTIAAGAVVGPRAVLGAGITVGAGATVSDAVLLDGASIGAGAAVREAIICAGAQVGADAAISGATIVGPGVRVGAGVALDPGARLFPGDDVADARATT
jgi:mannose-1-phosphate guanylyltransferase